MNDIQKEHLSPFFSVLVGFNKSNYTPKFIHESIMQIIDTKIYNEGDILKYPLSTELINDSTLFISPYSIKKFQAGPAEMIFMIQKIMLL
ncbi:hypothetical protein ACR30C_003964 [Enterobacter ludwigii]